MKHLRIISQYVPEILNKNEQETQTQFITYTDFQPEIQINIMSFIFQAKDFAWSEFHLTYYWKHLLIHPKFKYRPVVVGLGPTNSESSVQDDSQDVMHDEEIHKILNIQDMWLDTPNDSDDGAMAGED